MKLAALKTKLEVLTGTSIGKVYFDWQEYMNETGVTKTYPVVLWSLSGARFTDDARTTPAQPQKKLTCTVFAIASFNANTQDKITVWDTLEGYFKAYLNKMNESSGLLIENIDRVNGEYAGEGLISVDSEIGIMYKDVVIKMFCSQAPPVLKSAVVEDATPTLITLTYDVPLDEDSPPDTWMYMINDTFIDTLEVVDNQVLLHLAPTHPVTEAMDIYISYDADGDGTTLKASYGDEAIDLSFFAVTNNVTA